MPLKHRLFAALLVLGAYSQIVQALLIREGLVVFYGNEVSLGAFYGSWLFWLALGSLAVLRLQHHAWVAAALTSLRRLLLMLPLLLVLQVLALRSVRVLLDVSASELVPLGQLFLAFLLVTTPSSLVLGLAFPLGCKALRDVAEGDAVGVVSRLYIADAVGALLGGLAFTFVLIQWLGLIETLGLLTLALGVTAWSLHPGRLRQGWGALVLGAAGVLVAVTPAARWLDERLEALRFATLQPGLELLAAVETRYGHVAIARLGAQISVVGDGQIRESFPLPQEVAQQAAYFAAQASGAQRVLIFGGFAGGLATELLRYPLQALDQVEEDRRAFDAVRPWLTAEHRAALADPRLQVHFQDGRRFLQRLPEERRYGLILLLNASPASAYSNRYFTAEFYQQVRRHLTPEGIFCTQVSGASHYLGQAVGSYAGSIYRTLGAVLPHIAIAPGESLLLCAAATSGRVSEEPVVLERRYLDMDLAERRFPAAGFYTLLPAREIAFVRDRLEQAQADLNTDERPVTYYLNMVLWGKFSASGFVDGLERLRALGAWPYLLPIALGVGLWLLRSAMEGFRRPVLVRQGATFVLLVLGMIAMAAQLALLFSYQSHVGFMFERIALLNGLFMTGLALGAGAGQLLVRRRRSVLSLVLVMGAVAGGLLLLPEALRALGASASAGQEAGYLGLALAVGVLTGCGFPLGVDLTHRDLGAVLPSGGLTQAADNLGGALGGLLTGALMVPILGVEGTCRVLAAAAVLAILPLSLARLAPESIPGLRERGGLSFPWPRLGWALTFAVLFIYGWTLLERPSEPGARVRFDEVRLSAVSGSERFEFAEVPFPHYLGFAPESEAAETVSLSSIAAAPEVRGFAGPLNLLLAVDRSGILRGVRYVASAETPSYIAGIDDWLAALAGRDLSVEPLSLEQVDALSGATLTSRAALEALNRSAQRASEAAFGARLPRTGVTAGPELNAGFWLTAVLLTAFFPVYFAGGERARLALLIGSFALLGVWLNTLVTAVDLVNLSRGLVSTPVAAPQRWLLLGFVALTLILFGPVWCGYLCPFGALQELASRLGRRLGLRSYPHRPLEQRLRYLKYFLLAAMLIAAWLTGEGLWTSFDPMQHAFGGRLGGWMLVLTVAVILASLAYVRFWCRYFCPVGAFLALGNKLALLQRLAPRRRFEHCDLGVRADFDVDCIRCNRCLSGADTRLGHEKRER